MLRQLVILILGCVCSVGAYAKTVYTMVDGTVVLDQPKAVGSAVVAVLKSATMVETDKKVGAFTSVSFIIDGKVRTGFISTQQLEVGAADISKVGPGEASQIASAQRATNIIAAPAEMQVPVTDEPVAPLPLILDGLKVTPADLAAFAKSGKLIARKSKISRTPKSAAP